MDTVLLDQFVANKIGKPTDFDGNYGPQCVDLVRFYFADVLKMPQPKGVNGARDFYEKFESDPVLVKYFTKMPNTLAWIARKGDVIVWGDGTGKKILPDGRLIYLGHVGICLEANLFYLKVFSQNWNQPVACKIHWHNYLRPKILGGLRPKF